MKTEPTSYTHSPEVVCKIFHQKVTGSKISVLHRFHLPDGLFQWNTRQAYFLAIFWLQQPECDASLWTTSSPVYLHPVMRGLNPNTLVPFPPEFNNYTQKEWTKTCDSYNIISVYLSSLLALWLSLSLSLPELISTHPHIRIRACTYTYITLQIKFCL